MLCFLHTMRVPYIFLLVVLQREEACSLSCANGTIVDILAGHPNLLTCHTQEVGEWRLIIGNATSALIAKWENNKFDVINDFEKSFIIQNNSNQQSPLLFNPANNTKIKNDVSIVNGTLLCGYGKTACGLNYVYPAEGVSCTTVTSSWNVTVTCNICSAYSSRRIYKCHLIQRQQGVLTNNTLEKITMVTTSTNEPVAKNEVKVSGYCQLHTNFPKHEGSYAFYVNISPGRQSHVAKYSEPNSEWFTVELPSLPKMLCHPAPYVLENTNISCTCNTTSLGKPAGYLTWVTGKYTHTNPVRGDGSDEKAIELHYSQTLTLADHSTTWFRCDVTWGGQKHPGDKYTASVGYKPRQPQLSVNKFSENKTVTEGDSVDINCSADGRPAPTVILINAVNDTKMATGSSVILSNFTARCEDGGQYTCSAHNYFSSQTPLTTSLRLQVNCKPRSLSPDNVIKVRNMQFALIAYPMPRNITILPRVGDAATSTHSVVSVIPCTVHPHLPYNFTCNFTEKTPGSYHVVVTNDIGDGNFTLEVEESDDTTDSDSYNDSERTTGLVAGVTTIGVVLLAIVFAIIIVAVKTKKSGKRQILPRRDEYETPWDLVPLSINVLDVDGSREHLRPPSCYEDIGAVVVDADKEKQTQKDNKAEAMYANIGNSTLCEKAKTQNQKLEENKKTDKKFSGKPTHLDKGHVPVTGIERETFATEQVVNTTHHELTEYSNISSAAAAVGENIERCANQDGLIYTCVDHDCNLSRKRPSPRLQQTEYVEVTFKNGKPIVGD